MFVLIKLPDGYDVCQRQYLQLDETGYYFKRNGGKIHVNIVATNALDYVTVGNLELTTSKNFTEGNPEVAASKNFNERNLELTASENCTERNPEAAAFEDYKRNPELTASENSTERNPEVAVFENFSERNTEVAAFGNFTKGNPEVTGFEKFTVGNSGVKRTDVTDLASFMGHAEKIHKDHYRMPLPAREITKISALLELAQGDSVSGKDNEVPQVGSTNATDPETPEINTNNTILGTSTLTPCEKESDENFMENDELVDDPAPLEEPYQWSPSSYHPTSDEETSVNGTPEKNRKNKKSTWNTPERQAARKYLNRFIEKKELPPLSLCNKISKTYIPNRTGKQLKAWINNQIQRASSSNRTPQKRGAPHGGPFTRVSSLVTPRPRLRRTVPERGTTSAPPAKRDPASARQLSTNTAAAIRGRLNRTTPGELLPVPALAAAVLSQTRKTVEAKQDEVTLSSRRTTRGKKIKSKANLPSSSLSRWKAGDEDPPFDEPRYRTGVNHGSKWQPHDVNLAQVSVNIVEELGVHELQQIAKIGVFTPWPPGTNFKQQHVELLDCSGAKKGDSGWTNGIILCLATNQGFVCGAMMTGFAYVDIVVKEKFCDLPEEAIQARRQARCHGVQCVSDPDRI
ncbi:hypothetical protein GEV33_000050 [Tenebrio molitor]|uniref:Uncharacterized protein n=1 Tax=Tenebrio molitor TaxID=7067 RepID=A0A8J6LHR9_TENMO|nr:hypothetical protein GEV33_000050 [Tenebrio molitor]